MTNVELTPYHGTSPPVEGTIADRLRGEATDCHRWSNGPGATYAVHHHPYRKILYVTHGSITFTPGGAPPLTMHRGDRVEIPAGTPHAAEVGLDGVVCWEGKAKPAAAGGA